MSMLQVTSSNHSVIAATQQGQFKLSAAVCQLCTIVHRFDVRRRTYTETKN